MNVTSVARNLAVLWVAQNSPDSKADAISLIAQELGEKDFKVRLEAIRKIADLPSQNIAFDQIVQTFVPRLVEISRGDELIEFRLAADVTLRELLHSAETLNLEPWLGNLGNFKLGKDAALVLAWLGERGTMAAAHRILRSPETTWDKSSDARTNVYVIILDYIHRNRFLGLTGEKKTRDLAEIIFPTVWEDSEKKDNDRLQKQHDASAEALETLRLLGQTIPEFCAQKLIGLASAAEDNTAKIFKGRLGWAGLAVGKDLVENLRKLPPENRNPVACILTQFALDCPHDDIVRAVGGLAFLPLIEMLKKTATFDTACQALTAFDQKGVTSDSDFRFFSLIAEDDPKISEFGIELLKGKTFVDVSNLWKNLSKGHSPVLWKVHVTEATRVWAHDRWLQAKEPWRQIDTCGKDLVPRLIEFLSDDDAGVRSVAAAALGALSSSALTALIEHPSSSGSVELEGEIALAMAEWARFMAGIQDDMRAEIQRLEDISAKGSRERQSELRRTLEINERILLRLGEKAVEKLKPMATRETPAVRDNSREALAHFSRIIPGK